MIHDCVVGISSEEELRERVSMLLAEGNRECVGHVVSYVPWYKDCSDSVDFYYGLQDLGFKVWGDLDDRAALVAPFLSRHCLGKRVVDLGSGYGRVWDLVPAREVVLLDASKRVHEDTGGRVLLFDARRDLLPEGDVAHCAGVLAFLSREEVERVKEQLGRFSVVLLGYYGTAWDDVPQFSMPPTHREVERAEFEGVRYKAYEVV